MDRDFVKAIVVAAGGVVAAQALAVVLYQFAKEKRAQGKLKRTNDALADAQRRLRETQQQLFEAQKNLASGGQKKPVRIYMDGCFDMMHYGHSNALRQARAVGDVLVVGLVNDADIVKNKGSPPVLPDAERFEALSACKFVDEVIRDAPYDLTEDWVRHLVEVHKIDYIVHGDDPCFTADGKDAYAFAKKIGVYKQIKRTEGVSTTDIVGRMLLMTREHHLPSLAQSNSGANLDDSLSVDNSEAMSVEAGIATGDLLGGGDDAESVGHGQAAAIISRLTSASPKFLPTARRIMQFSEGKVPKPDDKVVYMCGAFDLFNAGHIQAIRKARESGDFLLVGVHDDSAVNRMRGHGLPILNLYERVLSLLACKYVDEVIIGAPFVITEEMIKTMNISVVVRGTSSDLKNKAAHAALGLEYSDAKASDLFEGAYSVPKKMGILKEFDSPSPLTALDIVQRIMEQREQYQKRYEKKSKTEADYVANKTYVQEN